MVNPDLKKRIQAAANEAASIAFRHSAVLRELMLELRTAGFDVKAELMLTFKPEKNLELTPAELSDDALNALYQLEDTREEK